MPVPFIQLTPVGEGNGGASARLQAIQTAISAQSNKKSALYNLLGNIAAPLITQGLKTGGDVLQRHAERKALDAENKAAQETSSLLGEFFTASNNPEVTGGQVPTQDALPMESLPLGAPSGGAFKGGATSAPPSREEIFSKLASSGRLDQDKLTKLANELGVTQAGRGAELDITGKGLSNQSASLDIGKKSDDQSARRELVDIGGGVKAPRFLFDADLDTRTKKAALDKAMAVNNGTGGVELSKKTINDLQAKIIGGAAKVQESDYMLGEIDYFKNKYGNVVSKLSALGSGRYLANSPDDASRFNRLKVNIGTAGLREMTAAQGRGASDAEIKAAQKRYGDIITNAWGSSITNLTGIRNEGVRDVGIAQKFLTGKYDLGTYDPNANTPNGSSVTPTANPTQQKVDSLNDQQYKAYEKLVAQGSSAKEALDKVSRGGK